MNNKPIESAKHGDAKHVEAALRRAAVKAREIARQTQTPFVTVCNGQVVSEIPGAHEAKSG